MEVYCTVLYCTGTVRELSGPEVVTGRVGVEDGWR